MGKMEIPAEASAVTKATVKSGLGYPNDRSEESAMPVGWNAHEPLLRQDVVRVEEFGSESDVSRETSG